MKLSASKEIIWTLELTDNEMAILYNYLNNPDKCTDPLDINMLEELKTRFEELEN